MCPPFPPFSGVGLGVRTQAGGSAHTPAPPEEIEKKLNIYHKGAKIWKMLIFCQVGLSAFPPGGGRAEEPSAWACACALQGSSGWTPVCIPPSPPHSLTGRPRTLVPAQEQGGHLCQSGEGRGHDPVSGQGWPWGCRQHLLPTRYPHPPPHGVLVSGAGP